MCGKRAGSALSIASSKLRKKCGQEVLRQRNYCTYCFGLMVSSPMMPRRVGEIEKGGSPGGPQETGENRDGVEKGNWEGDKDGKSVSIRDGYI